MEMMMMIMSMIRDNSLVVVIVHCDGVVCAM